MMSSEPGHAHSDGDHDHQHGAEVTQSNERRIRLVFILTAGYALVQAIGGWLAGSLALIADAGHMVSDSAALLLALVAYRVARWPIDAQRAAHHFRQGFQDWRREWIVLQRRGADNRSLFGMYIVHAPMGRCSRGANWHDANPSNRPGHGMSRADDAVSYTIAFSAKARESRSGHQPLGVPLAASRVLLSSPSLSSSASMRSRSCLNAISSLPSSALSSGRRMRIGSTRVPLTITS